MLDLKIRREPHYLLMEEMSPGWAFMMMQDYDRLPQDILIITQWKKGACLVFALQGAN